MIFCVIAFITDFIDGYIARKHNLVTNLGKLIDPMTDSLVTISILLTFTLDPIQLPMPLVFIFLYRDTLISTLRTLCALKGKALAASMTAKVKAWMQNITCLFVLGLLLFFNMHLISQATLQILSTLAVSITAVLSLYSGGEYLVNNWEFIKSEIK